MQNYLLKFWIQVPLKFLFQQLIWLIDLIFFCDIVDFRYVYGLKEIGANSPKEMGWALANAHNNQFLKMVFRTNGVTPGIKSNWQK